MSARIRLKSESGDAMGGDTSSMEPAIEYAQTRDGVNIAFWSVGEGPAIIQLPPTPWSHCQLEWEEPVFRNWYERLARNHRVIRYDARGTGLSDRDRFDYNLETLRADLDAVIERAGLEEFALLAPLQGGPPAISYSVEHPERVTQLMLWCTFMKPADFHTPQLSALRALATADWNLYTEVVAHALATGWEACEANRIAAYMRAGAEWEACRAAG